MKASDILDRARQDFRARESIDVECPEWGVTLRVKPPSLSTLSKAQRLSKGDPIECGARLVAMCAIDEQGERLFNEAEWKTFMMETSPGVVQRIADSIMKASGLIETASDLADAVKN